MTVDEIKQSVRIEDLAFQYGIEKQRGGKYKCPVHRDKNGSMVLYRKTNTFCCFGCNRAGDVIEFVQFIKGCEWKDAYFELGGTYEHEVEEHKQTSITGRSVRKQTTAVSRYLQKKEYENKKVSLQRNLEYLRGKKLSTCQRVHAVREELQAVQKPYIGADGEPVYPDEWVAKVNEFEMLNAEADQISEEIDQANGDSSVAMAIMRKETR